MLFELKLEEKKHTYIYVHIYISIYIYIYIGSFFRIQKLPGVLLLRRNGLLSLIQKLNIDNEPGLGIYKRKNESEQENNYARVHEKKTRLRRNDNGQESNQETTLSVKK